MEGNGGGGGKRRASIERLVAAAEKLRETHEHPAEHEEDGGAATRSPDSLEAFAPSAPELPAGAERGGAAGHAKPDEAEADPSPGMRGLLARRPHVRDAIAALISGGDDHGAPLAPARPDRPTVPGSAPGRRVKTGVWTTYKEKVAHLSGLIVRAQKPIRILDAIKWDDDVARRLIENRFTKLPAVGPKYYERIPLHFDPRAKLEEFAHIKKRIQKLLGETDDIGRILIRNCDQYSTVVKMLQVRGTHDFYKYSRELYGSPKDTFLDDQTTVRDLGHLLYEILDGLEEEDLGVTYERTISAEECVEMLNKRFATYFADSFVHAKLDDGIVSDAAAGADYIKVKRGVAFAPRDVDVLEVHEGWCHVGTTLNGQLQRVATWLAKGPPCTTDVQEGLAVLLEIFCFVSRPARAKKLNNRILACDKAEDGANILDIIEFYRTEGYGELDCVANAQRIFRGGVVRGGAPFTKDITYCKGFISNYNFMRTCIKLGRPELIPFLFAGKVTLEDVPVLYRKWKEGVVDRPKYVPRVFRDLNGIAMWMAYSNFFNLMNLDKIQQKLRPIILGT
jgi:uncharacterized protein (TIGR02421 family)